MRRLAYRASILESVSLVDDEQGNRDSPYQDQYSDNLTSSIDVPTRSNHLDIPTLALLFRNAVKKGQRFASLVNPRATLCVVLLTFGSPTCGDGINQPRCYNKGHIFRCLICDFITQVESQGCSHHPYAEGYNYDWSPKARAKQEGFWGRKFKAQKPKREPGDDSSDKENMKSPSMEKTPGSKSTIAAAKAHITEEKKSPSKL